MPEARTATSVISQIESAFAKVKLGNGVSIREAKVIDDYGGSGARRSARALDEKGDWRLIPDSLIAEHPEALSFFDAEGMRYNLPAYMRFTLRHHERSDSSSIDATIYCLTASDLDLARFNLFDESQRKAVRSFLEFMYETGDRSLLKDQKGLAKW